MENFFSNASNVMTVVSFVTFLCIVVWAACGHWDEAALLPFADEEKKNG
jgi:cytochrome c oxidase cbb3-type subunit 4